MLLSIEFEKSSMYASRENWYMGSMRPMSFITKKRMAARREQGRYPWGDKDNIYLYIHPSLPLCVFFLPPL